MTSVDVFVWFGFVFSLPETSANSNPNYHIPYLSHYPILSLNSTSLRKFSRSQISRFRNFWLRHQQPTPRLLQPFVLRLLTERLVVRAHPGTGLFGTSLVAQMVKCLSTMQETWVQSLGWEDPLEKEMAIHSSTIAWKIPWTEEPGRQQSTGSQRVGHDWVTTLSLYSL